MTKIKNCDDGREEFLMISNHEYVEIYNDGRISVLKCEKCGNETVDYCSDHPAIDKN